ncbi:hypothetical protein [Methylophaga sp.]|uniref:hypothetical protein n=1 Tax=Methylophaga sp. TaxID=2024840 RepID=UPI003F6A0112
MMTTSPTEKIGHPKKQLLYKFLLLSLTILGYFAYLSVEYNVITGGIASLLTWSFFVLCTPIADAGFLLDFPLRLLFGIRMFISEVVVWGVAITINIIAFAYFSEFYETTAITRLMLAILTTPYPYWSVIVLSGVGTFLSIRFADEIMDVVHHRDRKFFHRHGYKHEIIIILFFILVFLGYYKLIASLGIDGVL